MLLLESVPVLDQCDTEGRPLGEVKASAAARARAPLEEGRCPYRDSRLHHERPMNVSALQQLGRHGREVLTALARLRGLAGVSGAAKTSVELWRAAFAGELLPRFVAQTRGGGAPLRTFVAPARDSGAPLPAEVAVLYKVCAGLRYALEECALEQVLLGTGLNPLQADEVLAYADRHGMLVGASQVCAGSPRQIVEAVNALSQGHAAETTFLDRFLGADAPRFVRYVEVLADFAAWKRTFALTRRAIVDALLRGAVTAASDFDGDAQALVDWARRVFALEREVPRGSSDTATEVAPEEVERRCAALFSPNGLQPSSALSGDNAAPVALQHQVLPPALAHVHPRLAKDVAKLSSDYFRLERRYVEALNRLERALGEVLDKTPSPLTRGSGAAAQLVGARVPSFFLALATEASRVDEDSA
jgi:hypothetical protein